MTLKIDDSVKQQAIKLRAEGKSYPAIVTALSQYGATERWVRKVTKGVEKGKTPTQQVIEAIYPLAIRPCGVRDAECHEIFYDVFGCEWDEEQKKWTMDIKPWSKTYVRSEVRKMAEKNGKVANFVPDWMSTEFPEESKATVEEFTNNILAVLHKSMADYVDLYGCCDESTIKREFLSRIVEGYTAEPVRQRMGRFDAAASTLVAMKEKDAQNEAESVTEVLTNEEGSRAS